ncbi:MAG: hypothetical protein HXY19_05595 [Thermoanaerobaculaceae bacterium]|nr:hypothetical protein [Thermoanaerobaculaceae bacterium]
MVGSRPHPVSPGASAELPTDRIRRPPHARPTLATRALACGGVALSAEQVHAAALASLQSAYATVLPAATFLATLPLPSTPGATPAASPPLQLC